MEPSPATPPPDEAFEDRAQRRRDARVFGAQSAAAAVALVGSLLVVKALFGHRLEALGLSFVHRFGYAGMFVGTFLADGFHVPVPPQVYLLAAITSRAPQVASIAVISLASMLAGHVGYYLVGQLNRVAFFHRRIERSRHRVDGLFRRYGYWAVVVGSVTPVPYPVLCELAGLYRIPYRYFAVLVLLRVPRLLVFYGLIRLGWGHGA